MKCKSGMSNSASDTLRHPVLKGKVGGREVTAKGTRSKWFPVTKSRLIDGKKVERLIRDWKSRGLPMNQGTSPGHCEGRGRSHDGGLSS
jgi:hypothetical protein